MSDKPPVVSFEIENKTRVEADESGGVWLYSEHERPTLLSADVARAVADAVGHSDRLPPVASLGLTRRAGAEGWTFEAPDSAVVFERGNDRLVVIDNDMSVRWALLAWTCSAGDGSHAEYDLEAHGHGYAGELREPRHTYVGEDGYLFYVDPLRLAWAFDCLRRWFDFPGSNAQAEKADAE